MHPFLNQYIAQSHREELQREAAHDHLAHSLENNHTFRRTLYHLIFDLPIPSSPSREIHLMPERWHQQQIRTTYRTVGLGAFGIGSLLGGFLGIRFGLLPATLLACITCLAITLPIIRRSLKLFHDHNKNFHQLPGAQWHHHIW